MANVTEERFTFRCPTNKKTDSNNTMLRGILEAKTLKYGTEMAQLI